MLICVWSYTLLLAFTKKPGAAAACRLPPPPPPLRCTVHRPQGGEPTFLAGLLDAPDPKAAALEALLAQQVVR